MDHCHEGSRLAERTRSETKVAATHVAEGYTGPKAQKKRDALDGASTIFEQLTRE